MVDPVQKLIIPTKDSQRALVSYIHTLLEQHKKFTSYWYKMEEIDKAYARYKETSSNPNPEARAANLEASQVALGIFRSATTPPIVVSHVDSVVGYLAEVFLTGQPIFPIVSSPQNQVQAEQLEAILAKHSDIGKYQRQLLLFLRDAVKYNFAAVEVDWAPIEQYTISDVVTSPGTTETSKTTSYYNRIRRIDPYQLICDPNVLIGDISEEGDYAGYIEVYSRMRLKRMLQRLSDSGKAFNVREAMESRNAHSPESTINYRQHPQISNYISSRRPVREFDWYQYLGGKQSDSTQAKSNNFEVVTLYARVVPGDFQLVSPSPKTVQIWKFILVNHTTLVHAERVISAYDTIPILFGQPMEDGLGYQTQSLAESQIPIQQSAGACFKAFFDSAHRSTQDRALYRPDYIRSSDINSPIPTAKIPVKINSLDPNARLADAYYQIPFNAAGTEGALEAGMRLVGFGKELSGVNSPMQGQFQRGNKSVVEWQDTMGGADARLRLPALTLEEQVFKPLKNILKLNIYQFGNDMELVSPKTGKIIEVNMQQIRDAILEFQVADGYTPKSKLANTEMISGAMNMIAQSPILQQQFGSMLPSMFLHFMRLMGVKGMEEYLPQQPQQPQPPQ